MVRPVSVDADFDRDVYVWFIAASGVSLVTDTLHSLRSGAICRPTPLLLRTKCVVAVLWQSGTVFLISTGYRS